MRSLLLATQSSNAQLMENINDQRAQMEGLVRGLEHMVQDLEASAAMLSSEEVAGLVGEIKEMEQEMRG